jgi:hypothetical protein
VESSADEIGALCETVVFIGYFKDLPDARQIGKVKYPLDEILLLCLLAVVAGAEAGARSLPGTTTSSPVSSPHDSFHPIPLVNDGFVVRQVDGGEDSLAQVPSECGEGRSGASLEKKTLCEIEPGAVFGSEAKVKWPWGCSASQAPVSLEM